MATSECAQGLDFAVSTVLIAALRASVTTFGVNSFARLVAEDHGVRVGMAEARTGVAARQRLLAFEVASTIFCKLEIGHIRHRRHLCGVFLTFEKEGRSDRVGGAEGIYDRLPERVRGAQLCRISHDVQSDSSTAEGDANSIGGIEESNDAFAVVAHQ